MRERGGGDRRETAKELDCLPTYLYLPSQSSSCLMASPGPFTTLSCFFSSEQGSTLYFEVERYQDRYMQPWLSWNSLRKALWPWIHSGLTLEFETWVFWHRVPEQPVLQRDPILKAHKTKKGIEKKQNQTKTTTNRPCWCQEFGRQKGRLQAWASQGYTMKTCLHTSPSQNTELCHSVNSPCLSQKQETLK